MPTPIRCDPKLFDKDLQGQVIIVTGANSGCGLETTRQLYKQGATVILACRNEQKAKNAVEDVSASCPDSKGKLAYLHLDLSDLSSVRAFVKEFTSQFSRLDVLVNNAAWLVHMARPRMDLRCSSDVITLLISFCFN